MSFKFPLSAIVRTKNSDVPMLVEGRSSYKPDLVDNMLKEFHGGRVEEVVTENQYRCTWKDSNRRPQSQMFYESALVLVEGDRG